jgi:Zn finger protein HypA/HybF involved in hydrogenase expression
MTEDQMVIYLANIACVAAIDGDFNPPEAKTIVSICHEIGATEAVLQKALTIISRGDYRLFPVGRFSHKIRNLEDMIFVSLKDGALSESEKSEVLSFAESIKIDQDKFDEMVSESKVRVLLQKTAATCVACDKKVPPDSKFCPHCGVKMTG